MFTKAELDAAKEVRVAGGRRRWFHVRPQGVAAPASNKRRIVIESTHACE